MNDKTLLLNVDDTEVARYTKTRVLQHAGFDVVEAHNGRDALARMESPEQRPVLVLLDVRLPDMSGIDVCKTIKQRWPTTVVLQTSATFVTAGDRVRGLEGGADSYLVQPIDPDELVAAVRALLRLQQTEERLRALNESLERRIDERTRELREANASLSEQIARREQAEAELVQSQKMEAIGQLTGSLAHDFNNILASITGYIHVLRHKTGDPALHSLIDKALAAGDRGRRLTGRLLNFSRIESEPARPIDLGASVLGMREWLAQSLGPRNRLHVEVGPAPVVAATDANQFELAVLNLVINARDAMPASGEVRIEIATRELASADDDLGPGRYATVSVADTGEGMPDDVSARAFEPFFTTKSADRGTGLGLAQVHRLCREAGGSARIESRAGQGTRVTLWLPAVTIGAVGALVDDAGGASVYGTGERILVVDDEDDIRESLAFLLAERGYAVSSAIDGADALAQIAKETPDLLVLDYSMPGMNGIEVARRVRAEHPAMAILFVSGHADRETLRSAISGVDLLRKPFGGDELYDKVARSLSVG